MLDLQNIENIKKLYICLKKYNTESNLETKTLVNKSSIRWGSKLFFGIVQFIRDYN